MDTYGECLVFITPDEDRRYHHPSTFGFEGKEMPDKLEYQLVVDPIAFMKAMYGSPVVGTREDDMVVRAIYLSTQRERHQRIREALRNAELRIILGPSLPKTPRKHIEDWAKARSIASFELAPLILF